VFAKPDRTQKMAEFMAQTKVRKLVIPSQKVVYRGHFLPTMNVNFNDKISKLTILSYT
jgi:hypothetical protein